MYEFELQQEASKTKQKIMLLVLLVAIIASAIIGVALRMQQAKVIEEQQMNILNNPDNQKCNYCISEEIDFSITSTPTPTLNITEAPPITTPIGSPSATTPTSQAPTGVTNFSASLTGKDCVEPNSQTTFLLQITNTGNQNGRILKVQNAFPNGFSYVAGSTKINDRLLDAQYIKIESAGNAILAEFTIPDAFANLAPDDTLTLEYSAKADNPDVGTNTDLAIIVPYQGPAIDNITYQFEVANSCSTQPNLPTNAPAGSTPDTGILDNIYILGIVSVIFILLGVYLRKTKDIFIVAPFVKLYQSIQSYAIELGLRKDPKAYMEYQIIKKDLNNDKKDKSSNSSPN